MANCAILEIVRSPKNHPILVKFGTQQQILNSMTITWSIAKLLLK